MQQRLLTHSDYDTNYFDLLNQLTISPKCTRDQFNDFVDRLNENHIVSIFSTDTKIIATGTLIIEQKLIRDYGLVGHIEDVVVDKTNYGNGIGKKMIESLINICRSKKCYKIILDCSDDVICFYEKCGFTRKNNQMALYLH